MLINLLYVLMYNVELVFITFSEATKRHLLHIPDCHFTLQKYWSQQSLILLNPQSSISNGAVPLSSTVRFGVFQLFAFVSALVPLFALYASHIVRRLMMSTLCTQSPCGVDELGVWAALTSCKHLDAACSTSGPLAVQKSAWPKLEP